MSASFISRFFTCILPQLLQRWWMVCVGVFSSSSSTKEQGIGEVKTNTDIDIEAGIRPFSDVMVISAAPNIAGPDVPLPGDKSDFVSVSLRSSTSIANVAIDTTSGSGSSLTSYSPLTTRTPSIQIKVTKSANTSSRHSVTLPQQEAANIFHNKRNNRADEEIHNEKTRNRVSSQRQSIVDPVKARILDIAMKQVQDRTVGVHKKVIITTPAIKITPSSVRIEYYHPPASYTNDDLLGEKTSNSLPPKSHGPDESSVRVEETTEDDTKSRRRGIHFIQPPTIIPSPDTTQSKHGSANVIPSIVLESTQFPAPPSSVSGSSISSSVQSGESIQDILSLFPLPPPKPVMPTPLREQKKAPLTLSDDVTKFAGPYSRVTISPSSSSDSSLNSTLDISISSEEDGACSASESVTSEAQSSPVEAEGESPSCSTITKRTEAYYPPGISGKSRRSFVEEDQTATPFVFPALPRTPPKQQGTTHDRKQSKHLRPSSGEWLSSYSKLASDGHDSYASQLSNSVSVSVSSLSVFTEQYHEVVDTFNKAVEDNRRQGGAFHFNQDSLSAVLSKGKQSTGRVDDENSRDDGREGRQDASGVVSAVESKAVGDEAEDEHSDDAASDGEEFTYKSSLRKRPDSLVWFTALDEVRAQEKAEQRASSWETDLDSVMSDEEYTSTTAFAISSPKPVSPLKIVKKVNRASASSSSSESQRDESQTAERFHISEHNRVSVRRLEDHNRQSEDDEDRNNASSDETWFSSDTHVRRRAHGQATESVTTLSTPELDANDIFTHDDDESIDSMERSIDEILDMLDRQVASDSVRISGSSGPASPVDVEQHSQISVKQGKGSRNHVRVSVIGAPPGTESVGVDSIAPVRRYAKRRQDRENANPWRNRPLVDDEQEGVEDEDEPEAEECWGDLFAEIHAI